MNNSRNTAILLLVGAIAFSGCKNDKNEDPVPPPPANEEEVITTVMLHFESATDHKHLEWQDPDGAGGTPPAILVDTLEADSTYTLEVELLNQAATPDIDIGAEVAAEAEAHQFFFQVSGTGSVIAYNDADVNGNPIGLLNTCTAGPAGSGTLTVILRHQPDKFAAGVAGGDITNAGGETDVEVVFPFVVQ